MVSAAVSSRSIQDELIAAQRKAKELFQAIERESLATPYSTEKQVSDGIYALAQQLFGIKRYWHKRVVRAGANTLCPFKENPPDLVIQEDDIVFIDLGPVFEEWEADFGKTFVIGNDPDKQRIKRDSEQAFAEGKKFYQSNPAMPAAELYGFMRGLAHERGWDLGNPHCGHLVGYFPNEFRVHNKILGYIHPENSVSMQAPDADGNPRYWILEVHFVDREKKIGAFYEDLLNLD